MLGRSATLKVLLSVHPCETMNSLRLHKPCNALESSDTLYVRKARLNVVVLEEVR